VEKSLQELRLNVLAGSMCTATSVAITNPLDTLRIRWQIATKENAGKRIYNFGTRIIQKEGLFKGLWFPGCLAHMGAVSISSGIRLGFYPTIRDLIAEDEDKNALHMWSAGFIAGAAGFWLANPLFQAKVRIQASLMQSGSNHKGLISSINNTFESEGVKGLYRGSTVLMARGALLSAGAQLGYDYVKTTARRQNLMDDGPMLHLISSISSAFLAVTFCTPADFIMTKYQSAPALGIKYKSIFDCIKTVVSKNGVFGLYRGWTPLFMRIGPLFIINMPLYEQCRRLLGLSYLT